MKMFGIKFFKKIIFNLKLQKLFFLVDKLKPLVVEPAQPQDLFIVPEIKKSIWTCHFSRN